MALIKETKHIPAREEERVVGVICELCGRRGFREGDWGKVSGDRSLSTVTQDEGTVYQEGGYFTRTKLDICPECFTSKLIPWFEAQGGKVRTEEVEV